MYQDYNSYTPEDHQAWSTFYYQELERLTGTVSRAFIRGLTKINVEAQQLPNLPLVLQELQQLSGWSFVFPEAATSARNFLGMFYQRQLPITALPTEQVLAYPQMVAFAQVPQLTEPAIADFLFQLGRIAELYPDNDIVHELLIRLWWYTACYGLTREEGKVRVYGAAIIASATELEHSVSTEAVHLPFIIEEILASPRVSGAVQEKYFVLKNYQQLALLLPKIEDVIKQYASGLLTLVV